MTPSANLLHQQLELLDRVLVGRHVVAQLAHPDEAELLPAVLDLLQGLVDELGVDDARPHEAALRLLDEVAEAVVQVDAEFAEGGGVLGSLFAEVVADSEDAPLLKALAEDCARIAEWMASEASRSACLSATPHDTWPPQSCPTRWNRLPPWPTASTISAMFF